MRFLLDTNACIQYLNGRSERLRVRLDGAEDEGIAVCSVVKAELCYGAMRSRDPERTLRLQREFLARFGSFPFDDASAAVYGSIRADLERQGITVGGNDLMIAAIAMARGLTLVTHNVAEFERIAGLRLEDWEREGETSSGLA